MTKRHDAALADAVRRGLTAPRKQLPPFLFYDAKGSALFEAITRLPEYYLTRTERSILELHAEAIVRTLVAPDPAPLTVVELGAGSAEKTELLLRSLDAQIGGSRPVTYIPADVSPTPLAAAQARLARSLPRLRVSPMLGPHDEVLARIACSEGPLAIPLFLGSSIGNYEDGDAISLLSRTGHALGRRGPLLLGLDHSKPLDVLLPAYDDDAGVFVVQLARSVETERYERRSVAHAVVRRPHRVRACPVEAVGQPQRRRLVPAFFGERLPLADRDQTARQRERLEEDAMARLFVVESERVVGRSADLPEASVERYELEGRRVLRAMRSSGLAIDRAQGILRERIQEIGEE
ncbi:MAG: L-histidine N(alpha)-methyltransferase [Deltaproteobacteria bacterium]|nr:L-histidine N(alpha)-methyltransferase [Deltaproteobacteria bacterium]